MTTPTPSRWPWDEPTQHIRPVQPPPPRRRWLAIVAILALVLVGVVACSAAMSSRAPAAPSPSAPALTPVESAPAAPSAAPQPTGPRTTVGSGTYVVGEDVEPGRYKTPGPDGSSWRDSCYWERARDDSGAFSSIIANDNIEGPGSLTVKAGEVLKLSGPCTWSKQ